MTLWTGDVNEDGSCHTLDKSNLVRGRHSDRSFARRVYKAVASDGKAPLQNAAEQNISPVPLPRFQSLASLGYQKDMNPL